MVMTLSFFVYKNVLAANAPALKEGTYLTGQTLSTWPSWSLLGNTLGVSLPTDPINQLGVAGTCAIDTNRFCIKDSTCESPVTTSSQKCVLHDPVTGWSVADRRFTFACAVDSYAYRYIYSTTTPGAYTVRARFEDPGISPANNSAFVSSFINTSTFIVGESSGVCSQDPEISSMQSGVCGDGKLNINKGEQCDPPGRIEYAVGCVGTVKNLTVCNSGCQWVASTTLCSKFSHCGNGSLELGETCDDGVANGKYNKCNITCTGKSAEYCGDGITITQSAYEVCDPGTPGVEKYSITSKTDSCSWDCQNWGPYCGDAIVQTNHQEECDGSQTCSIDGNPGVKVCASNCKKEDKDAVAWWRFEKFMTATENTTADASVNANTATCNVATDCPKADVGKYGNDFRFTQNSTEHRFFTVAHSASLTPTTSLTVEAWIYPVSTGTLFQRIIEKGGPSTHTGYDLEFNISSATSTLRFNLWNGTPMPTAVDSNSVIPLNTWTHVVGTYQRNGTTNISKIYINGVLENTNSVDSATPIMAVPNTGNLVIGNSVGATNNYFFGSLDEIKIYNRVLSASEVQNNYQTGWFCSATSTVVVSTAPGTCGDNVVNTNEDCDRGVANNGRACVPSYGAPCSYCSADCQNTIDVQPTQYCGDGVIESAEKCEVAGGIIYSVAANVTSTLTGKNFARNGYQEKLCSAEPKDLHTIKKGTKSCDVCVNGVVRNCVTCGLDKNGVSVEGNIMNVLDNPIIDTMNHTSPNPLFAGKAANSSLGLAVGSCPKRIHQNPLDTSDWLAEEANWLAECFNPDPSNTSSPIVAKATKTASDSNLTSYTLLNPYVGGTPVALISSNPACSIGDTNKEKYQMYVNNDWTRPLIFSVVAEPQPWQNDLVLSPVVSSTKRARDVRVVVSWIGSGDFYGGVLNPFVSPNQLEGPSYVSDQLFYDSEVGRAYVTTCPSDTTCSHVYQYATDVNYYSVPADFKKTGVWYHGFNSTPGQTSEEAFTIDTSAMSGNTYVFYVRAPSFPIRTFKISAKLKVDVYLPETDSDQYHFGTPVKTYYLQSAAPSDNQNARFWQVFNINAPTSSVAVSDIIDVNTIVTGIGEHGWIYGSLVPNPPCKDVDWTSSTPSPAACPVTTPHEQTVTWTKNPTANCVGGVTHLATEIVSCECTSTDWTYIILQGSRPMDCPESGIETRVWGDKKTTSNCEGGFFPPPDSETIHCTYLGGSTGGTSAHDNPATCYDRIKNGAETGVDCGGSCAACIGGVSAPIAPKTIFGGTIGGVK